MTTSLKKLLRPLAGLLLVASVTGCALTPMHNPGSDNWERELGEPMAPLAPVSTPAAPQA